METNNNIDYKNKDRKNNKEDYFCHRLQAKTTPLLFLNPMDK